MTQFPWTQVYGGAVVVLCVAAALFARMGVQWASLLVLARWWASNMIYVWNHPPALVWAELAVDQLFAVSMATVLYLSHRRKSIVLVTILWGLSVWWRTLWLVGFYWLGWRHFHDYYAGSNVLFSGQLIFVGWLVVESRRHRVRMRDGRQHEGH